MTPQNSVSVVCKAEKSNEQHMLNPVEGRTCWINPSKMLVDTVSERWINSKLWADNTSVVTVMLDPPGPPRAQVLKNRQLELAELNSGTFFRFFIYIVLNITIIKVFFSICIKQYKLN